MISVIIPFLDEKTGRLWVNAGVIGLPANDGTTRVWYLIVNPKEDGSILFEHKSYEYDFGRTAKSIEKANLPTEYAATIRTGIWPNCDVLPEKETKEQGKRFNFQPIIYNLSNNFK